MDFKLPETGWTSSLFIFGSIICFGVAIPAGMQVSVINAPAEHIQRWCRDIMSIRYGSVLSPDEMELFWASVVTVSVMMGMFGCLSGGLISSKLGRKKTFLISGTLLVIAALCFLCCRAASSVELLFIGRIVAGLALGLTISVMPMYLSEVSPLKLRGAMGVLLPLGITAGVVVGQIVTLDQLLGSADLWHYGLGCGILFSLFCFIPYLWLPESPEYLYTIAKNPEDALKVIEKLFGKNAIDDAFVKQIRVPVPISKQTTAITLWTVLMDNKLRLPLVLLFSMNVGCALSGINAIFSYSVSTLVRIGISSNDAKLVSVGFGCINLAASSCGPFLMARFNRRPLMLISCIACGTTLLINTVAIHFIDSVDWFAMASIGAIVLFLLSYQLGVGQIPFFIGSELFDIEPRASALALGTFGSWSANFIILLLFPIEQHAWGAFAFLPSSVVCFVMGLFVFCYLPETRGRNISDTALLVSKGFKSKVW